VAWVAAGDALHALDLPAPAAPAPRGLLTRGPPLHAVAARDGQVALAGSQGDLIVVDATDPGAPALLAATAGGPAYDVALEGGRVFVAAGRAGVRVYDLLDPTAPVLVAWHDTSSTASAVAADGATVHVATADAQHWVFGCTACAAPCDVVADLRPAVASACEGETVLLDASASVLPGCDPADVTFRWSRDGQPLPAASGPTYEVPATLPPGAYLIEVEASCATEPACADTAAAVVTVEPETHAVVAAGSLRAREEPGAEVFTWVVASGSGPINVHRTLLPWELTAQALSSATLVAVEATAEHRNTASPAPERCLYFRVFGRMACSGGSAFTP
jgi:hypothetical protein